jgi:hypothetical protein
MAEPRALRSISNGRQSGNAACFCRGRNFCTDRRQRQFVIKLAIKFRRAALRFAHSGGSQHVDKVLH